LSLSEITKRISATTTQLQFTTEKLSRQDSG